MEFAAARCDLGARQAYATSAVANCSLEYYQLSYYDFAAMVLSNESNVRVNTREALQQVADCQREWREHCLYSYLVGSEVVSYLQRTYINLHLINNVFFCLPLTPTHTTKLTLPCNLAASG